MKFYLGTPVGELSAQPTEGFVHNLLKFTCVSKKVRFWKSQQKLSKPPIEARGGGPLAVVGI